MFHSVYWAQRRLYDAIAAHAKLAHGTLIDVGCGLKPYEQLFEPFVERYIGLEYSPDSGYRGNNADLCGDVAVLPLADESVDTILCTEVMSDLPNPEKAIEEFVRVIRPGGTVIVTSVFVFPVVGENDFFRFTGKGLAEIMKRHGLVIEEITPLSGTAVTLALMFNLYWYNVGFIWTKWLYPIGLLLRPLLWLLILMVNLLGGLFEIILPDDRMSFDHLTVATKVKALE